MRYLGQMHNCIELILLEKCVLFIPVSFESCICEGTHIFCSHSWRRCLELGIVTVRHLDIERVERGKLSLVPSPWWVFLKLINLRQLLDEMDDAWCNLDLNLPFPWWLCQTLGKMRVAILLKGSNLAQTFGQMLVKYCIQCIDWPVDRATCQRGCPLISIFFLSALSILLLTTLSLGIPGPGCCFLSP